MVNNSKKEMQTTARALSHIVGELYDKKLSKEDMAVLFSTVATELTKSLFTPSVKTPEITIPLSIFNSKLGVLECVVKFLRENCGRTNVAIADILGRKQVSVASTYHAAIKKMPQTLQVTPSPYDVPVSIFKHSKLSVLETLVIELKTKYNLKNSEIAKLLHRDDRTIWTVVHRAQSRGTKA